MKTYLDIYLSINVNYSLVLREGLCYRVHLSYNFTSTPHQELFAI